MNNLLSLDISSVSTGWSFFENGVLKDFGIIKINKGYSLSAKLYWFKHNIDMLLKLFKPDHIIAEETYLKNVTTLKILMQFIGIVNLECFSVLSKDIIFISPQTVRGYYKLKDKLSVFNYVKNKYRRKLGKYKFVDGNDITDAIILGLYWYDNMMEDNNNDKK